MDSFNSEKFKRIVVKVGSSVITNPDGSLNVIRMSRIVEDIASLHKEGISVVLVTSGAVAAGRSDVVPTKRNDEVSIKQMWAAIGQVKLMTTYQYLFQQYKIVAGQVLAAKETFSDRRHYLNVRNCIGAMLAHNVVPIVNENDTVSVSELMFTDNDELSGVIASMMGCEALLLLSNVYGIFTDDPSSPTAELIREVEPDSNWVNQYISPIKSNVGRGGMRTKCTVAQRLAAEGIDVFIANGNTDSIIYDIVNGKDVPRTHFIAAQVTRSDKWKWVAHSEDFAKSGVYVNKGAKDALLGEKPSSLLLVGVESIQGEFKQGDIIKVYCGEEQIAFGKAQYDSEDLKARNLIGAHRKKPLIYYNYLCLV